MIQSLVKATIGAFLILGISGCAVNYIRFDPEVTGHRAVENLRQHAKIAATKSYAALVQATVHAPSINRRFNVEIYARNDSIAFYSGGFLGKGGFKAVAYGDSVKLALLSDKQLYEGATQNFLRPDVSRYDYVRQTIFQILRGDYLLLDAGIPEARLVDRWKREVNVSGNQIKRIRYESDDDSLWLEVRLGSLRDDFPYAAISELRFQSESSGSSIKLVFIESKFTEIPDKKFSMSEFEGWERLEYIDLE